MDLMGQLHRMDKDQVLEFVCACYNPSDGGFAPALHHDSHLIYTLSAVQVGVVGVWLARSQAYVVAHTSEE